MTTGYFLRYIVVLVAFVWLLFLPHDRLDVYGMIFPSAMALIINALVGIVGIICLSSLIASSCVKYPRRRFLFGILQLGGSKFITYYGITLSFAYNDVLYDYTINNKDTGSLRYSC